MTGILLTSLLPEPTPNSRQAIRGRRVVNRAIGNRHEMCDVSHTGNFAKTHPAKALRCYTGLTQNDMRKKAVNDR